MLKLYEITKNYFNDDRNCGVSATFVKSWFKVKKSSGFEEEQAKLDRYYRYFAKLDETQYNLIQELNTLCSNNQSIDVDAQDLVGRLHELVCGGNDG